MSKRGSRQSITTWGPANRDMPDALAIPHLASAHDVPGDEELWKLFETVREYAIRDQKPGQKYHGFLLDREDAFRDAKSIVSLAHVIRASLAELRAAVTKFSADFEYDPVLMEEVFDIDVGPPGQLTLAPGLALLSGFAEAQQWEPFERRVKAICDLPLRKRLPRGRVAPRTLQKCVAACRRYWVAFDRTWKRQDLTDADTISDNDPAALTGECERFVSDVLRAAGIEHTLEQLSAAMNKRPKQRS